MSIKGWWRTRQTESITLESVEIEWLGLKGKWVADRAQQEASWQLYVELITRISLQSLKADEGLLREALTSLYSLFGETRRILKEHGPGVARPLGGGTLSLGQIAVEVLNQRLRPILAKWHPLLQAYEATRPPNASPRDFERDWSRAHDLRDELEKLRNHVSQYADLLARSCGIKPIHSGSQK